jgi:hypothetical protein
MHVQIGKQVIMVESSYLESTDVYDHQHERTCRESKREKHTLATWSAELIKCRHCDAITLSWNLVTSFK